MEGCELRRGERVCGRKRGGKEGGCESQLSSSNGMIYYMLFFPSILVHLPVRTYAFTLHLMPLYLLVSFPSTPHAGLYATPRVRRATPRIKPLYYLASPQSKPPSTSPPSPLHRAQRHGITPQPVSVRDSQQASQPASQPANPPTTLVPIRSKQ